MTATKPETPQLKASASLLATIPVPPPPVTGSTTLEVQLIPAPKLDFWEGPGFFPACAALVAVGITYVGLQRSTKKQIDANALRAKEQLDHALGQAKEDREHSREQADKERDHSGRQATLDRLLEARQALYIKLIDDYVDVLRMFGSMSLPDYSSRPDSGLALQKMAASVNKTWLLSDVPTAYAVRDFYSSLNEMSLRLMKHVAKFNKIRATDKAIEDDIDRLQDHLKQLRSQLDNFAQLERDDLSPVHRGRYATSMQQLRDQIGTIESRLGPLYDSSVAMLDAHSDQHRAFMEDLTIEQTAMMKQINVVMAAARTELGLSGDISILEQQSEVMTARVSAALAEFALAAQPIKKAG